MHCQGNKDSFDIKHCRTILTLTVSVNYDYIYNSAVQLGCKIMFLYMSSGIANDTGGITLIPISVNLSQQSKVESHGQVPLTAQALTGASPNHSRMNQAQEAHQSAGSKPKKTGSMALFYRKVNILAKSCFVLNVFLYFRETRWVK